MWTDSLLYTVNFSSVFCPIILRLMTSAVLTILWTYTSCELPQNIFISGYFFVSGASKKIIAKFHVISICLLLNSHFFPLFLRQLLHD
jgi:hypothetical protein